MKKLVHRNTIITAVVIGLLLLIYIELAVGLVGSPWAGS